MSIFPKRSVRGGNVTIHWNFNSSGLADKHLYPFVRIGVKDPQGKVTMLLEKHILTLPLPVREEVKMDEPQVKFLNKNVPLVVLADYLSGKFKKEKLVEILHNIQSGRHYYFPFNVATDAPLGKYELISEIHIDGEVRYSKTAPDDFFLIEQIELKAIRADEKTKTAIIRNNAPEPTPVKVVSGFLKEDSLKTEVSCFDLEPEMDTAVPLPYEINYLLYSEEREVLPLNDANGPFLLRNQQILSLKKDESITFLLKKDEEDVYELTGITQSLWQKADGLKKWGEFAPEEQEIYGEMIVNALIREL